MKKIIFTIINLTIASVMYAQIHVSPPLYDAIHQAIANNVEIQSNLLEIEKMDMEQKGIKRKFLPRLEASAMYAYLNNELTVDIPTQTLPMTGIQLFDGKTTFNNSGQAFVGGIKLNQIIYSGGQIKNGAKALKYKNEGTAYLMENQKDDIIKDIIISFDQLSLLHEAEKLLNNSEKRLNKETERVEKAITAGLAIPYDRDKIKLAQLELASKRKDVESKKELLILKLMQSTKLNKDEILNIIYQLEPIILQNDLLSSNKNEIKALEAFKNATEYTIKKEKGSLLPKIGAFASYQYASIFDLKSDVNLYQKAEFRLDELTLHPNFMVGIGMKWSIFEGFERKEKIKQAQLSQQQIDLKLSDVKEKLDLSLAKSQSEYQTATEQMKIHQQRKQIAKNNNTLAQKQYANGLMSISNRLEAENDTFKASFDWVESVAEQRKKAIEAYQSAGALIQYLTVK